MTTEKSYKDTLNLPQTAFPMKADLAKREPELLKTWEAEALYASVRKKSAGKPQYILHDGPPYANGRTHIGHSLNKILKDIIVKYQTLKGQDAFYVPGWDCHGLPIEHQALKELGKRKDEVERLEFRRYARKYAEKFIGIQRDEFIRLGVFGEWEKPYLTMSCDYQAAIAASFLSLYEKGFIEQRLKPVPWCFDCETALADAELEYEDKTDQTVYVKFPALNSAGTHYLVWTTTPWTLPANTGLALHPDLEYVTVESEKGRLIFARDLVKRLSEKIGIKQVKEIETKKGKDFAPAEAQHPFLDRKSRVILADYVSAAEGTGIVHIAPGHGEEDYQYGHLKNGLPILSPVDEKGRFTDEFPFAAGVHVFKANSKIVELLREKGALLYEEPYPHSYPHCWRCRKPILFRATPQWFLKIEHLGLRDKMRMAIREQIQFTPDWGKNRIGSMVETRPDWCLSRQRYWGVPVPVIGCANCPGTFFIKQSRERIMVLFTKEGADSWFSHPAGDFLPDDFQCPKCGKTDFEKEDDIIDVWFDSGVSHQAVLKRYPGLRYPADLYLEGSDQHRGWFQSALTTALALEGTPPFKGVLTHGFVVDGEGRKMSKSAGNVVAPQDVMKEFGADIMRLWVSSCDYSVDVRLSKEILKQLADQYRKIRNTFRYLLANLYDFDAGRDALAFDKLHPLDRYAAKLAESVMRQVDDGYEKFQFHTIYRRVHDFCSLDLSSYYFDLLKDTLYTARRDSFLRRSAQTGLYHVLVRLVRMLAPILPFTADEVWRSFKFEDGVRSVHEASWNLPPVPPLDETFQDWCGIRALRDALTPFLEKKREAGLIGSSLDAKVSLKIENEKLNGVFRKVLAELARVFIVSQVCLLENIRAGGEEGSVSLPDGSGEVKIFVWVEKADGLKCVRCWNYSTVVGTDHRHPGLCGKCLEALR